MSEELHAEQCECLYGPQREHDDYRRPADYMHDASCPVAERQQAEAQGSNVKCVDCGDSGVVPDSGDWIPEVQRVDPGSMEPCHCVLEAGKV